MIAGLDSSFDRPTPAIAAAARAAGVGLWSGYLATRSNVGLASPWDQASFEVARGCGATPLAYCSGWDDPLAVRQLALAWNVRPCLDVEAGIRGDGAWVQPWLDASGAGLYGNWGVHGGRRAAFHVLSAYPSSGDPLGASWWAATPRPPGPCAWQWAGSHPEFGCEVDSTWLDDWFATGGPDVLDPNDPTVQRLMGWLQNTTEAVDRLANVINLGDSKAADWPNPWLPAQVQQLATQVQQLQTTVAQLQVPPANLQPLADQLTAIAAVLARIEKGLQGT